MNKVYEKLKIKILKENINFNFIVECLNKALSKAAPKG